MTTSPKPWSLKQNVDGSTSVLDAHGNVIGVFKDWRDADAVCLDELLPLKEKIEELEDDIRDLKEENGQLKARD